MASPTLLSSTVGLASVTTTSDCSAPAFAASACADTLVLAEPRPTGAKDFRRAGLAAGVMGGAAGCAGISAAFTRDLRRDSGGSATDRSILGPCGAGSAAAAGWGAGLGCAVAREGGGVERR